MFLHLIFIVESTQRTTLRWKSFPRTQSSPCREKDWKSGARSLPKKPKNNCTSSRRYSTQLTLHIMNTCVENIDKIGLKDGCTAVSIFCSLPINPFILNMVYDIEKASDQLLIGNLNYIQHHCKNRAEYFLLAQYSKSTPSDCLITSVLIKSYNGHSPWIGLLPKRTTKVRQ